MTSEQRSIDEPHRYELQDRYLESIRVALPVAARQQGWLVTEDHCFMRILLDQLFQGCWYDHLDRRLTAYKQLNENQLSEVIAMAEKLLAGDAATLARWNTESLQWRGKLK